jgi:hypothetical protein
MAKIDLKILSYFLLYLKNQYMILKTLTIFKMRDNEKNWVANILYGLLITHGFTIA